MASQVRKAFIVCTLVSFCFYFFEWLFFVTRASPLSLTRFSQQVYTLAVSPLPLFFLTFASSIALILAFKLLRLKKTPLGPVLIPSAFIAACTIFLLVDNFTYNFFRISSTTYNDWRRLLFLATFTGLCCLSYKQLQSMLNHETFSKREKLFSYLCGAFIGLASIFCGLNYKSLSTEELSIEATSKNLPNIVILATDGLRTNNMSAYGYGRKTTPFIDTIIDESLVFENHYSNNAKTTGSVLSMLSGKLPTTTRVIFRPDVFKGNDMFQHLPGLLRKLGYFNGDISVRHYVDAFDVNMRDAFDFANNRTIERKSPLKLPPNILSQYGTTVTFLRETSERLTGRLKHISGIAEYRNPFKEVQALNTTSRGTDGRRLVDLKEFIKTSPQPFFASTHMLNTHGPLFFFDKPHFSKNKKKQKPWKRDFYDDSILNYDGYVKEVVSLLKEMGVWENTIFIINSDHGMRWSTSESIPLIIRFPGGKYSGKISTNSQRVDIAPTILDFLGAKIPSWMEGISLLQPELDPYRSIYIGNRAGSATVKGWRQVPNPRPPFYTLGNIVFIRCQQWFGINLRKKTFMKKTLKTQTSPCVEKATISDATAKKMLLKHLEDRNYDISSLSQKL